MYKITNSLTGEFYIDSSINVKSRFSNHLNRDARRYYGKHKFYTDIIDIGKEYFITEILEECNKEILIEREQYYYDTMNPTYNMVRPTECNFIYSSVRDKAVKMASSPEVVAKRKELYNTEEYVELFRKVHIEKMKPVYMIKDGEIINEFISMQEASRYISETTNFKGKNKTSKIKAVCDRERPTAYGYVWRYKDV